MLKGRSKMCAHTCAHTHSLLALREVKGHDWPFLSHKREPLMLCSLGIPVLPQVGSCRGGVSFCSIPTQDCWHRSLVFRAWCWVTPLQLFQDCSYPNSAKTSPSSCAVWSWGTGCFCKNCDSFLGAGGVEGSPLNWEIPSQI